MADDYAAFRDELLGAGVLVATGVDGLYGRSGTFEAVVDAIEAMVRRAGEDQAATVLRFPPLIPRQVFERTDYLGSFPNLIGSVHTFSGGDKEHVALVSLAERGDDWTAALVPSELMLCPAACHPLYPTVAGVLPPGGRRFDLYGWVFRHEPAVDPARMQAFRQREYVYLGEPDGAEAHRDLWVDRGLALLSDLGLAVDAVVANDPFFGRLGRMLVANQRDDNLKYEVVTPVCSEEQPTAIMSANCHRDHFGAPFGILTADGQPAHSACVGFGVERITLALLHTHGLDPEQWPAVVRSRLWG